MENAALYIKSKAKHLIIQNNFAQCHQYLANYSLVKVLLIYIYAIYTYINNLQHSFTRFAYYRSKKNQHNRFATL